jgi:hypothetical protein
MSEVKAQRDYMRELVNRLGDDEPALVAAYAKAERDGLVVRKSDEHDIKPEAYARALYADKKKKGW